MASNKEHALAMVEAFNVKNFDEFMNLAGDLVYQEIATGRTMSGQDYRDGLEGWASAFPDVTGTVTSAVEAGDKVYMEITWQGTHTGPMATPEGAIPPTGKSQTTKAIQIIEFEGDQPKTSSHYFDMLGMLKQLGLA